MQDNIMKARLERRMSQEEDDGAFDFKSIGASESLITLNKDNRVASPDEQNIDLKKSNTIMNNSPARRIFSKFEQERGSHLVMAKPQDKLEYGRDESQFSYLKSNDAPNRNLNHV